jgi:hypothetical protein
VTFGLLLVVVGLIAVLVVLRRRRRKAPQKDRAITAYLTNDLIAMDTLQTAYRHDMTTELRHDFENPNIENVTIVGSDDENMDELI